MTQFPNWREVSKRAAIGISHAVGGLVLVESPHADMTPLRAPEVWPWVKHSTVERFKHPPTAKEVRRFLWERRRDRVLQRDRGFVWWRHLPSGGEVEVGLGTLTHRDAASALRMFQVKLHAP